MTSSRILLLLLASLAAGAALTQARAAPLDAETCTKLMIEQGTLEKAGVEQDMAKGTEWAKANLGLEKLGQLRRFIELEELILFRCRSKSLVTLPPDPETEPQDKDQDKDKDKDKDQDKEKDKQAKDDHDKQETVIPKTVPKAAAPSPATKAEAPEAPAKADPKQAGKSDPKQKGQVDKKAAGDSTKAGDSKAQPKALSKKQDAPASKSQTKDAAPQPPTSGTAAGQKSPPKAKVDDASKAPQPPDDNQFGETFVIPSK